MRCTKNSGSFVDSHKKSLAHIIWKRLSAAADAFVEITNFKDVLQTTANASCNIERSVRGYRR